MGTDYIKATISGIDAATQELLLALLAADSYESFEQEADALLAYIPAQDFEEKKLREICAPFAGVISLETIAPQNWNAAWEAGFSPVVMPGFCAVRAHFHEAVAGVAHDLIITPRMAFGTGHHATTYMMLHWLQTLDCKDKTVLDFGTGTGVLGILALRLGAAETVGVDIDEWAVANAKENAALNGAPLEIFDGGLEAAPDKAYDLILANINRHILLDNMVAMNRRTAPGGRLLLSGILAEDEQIIADAAAAAGFIAAGKKERSGWLALLFEKPAAD